jgi:hypothetical protein
MDIRLHDVHQSLCGARSALGNVLEEQEDYHDRQVDLDDVTTLYAIVKDITLQLTMLGRLSHDATEGTFRHVA